jgi:protein tyrosine phosphatase (PTP) superfamily phosphohydrolase (DUF442 family)
MTPQSWLRLGLATLLMGQTGCNLCKDSCGERRGLFGWRERARERELAKERQRDIDPMRPRLDDPIPPNPRDTIAPPPEIPTGPRSSNSSPFNEIGPSPGSWVGPPIEARKPPQPQRELPPWPSEVGSGKAKSNKQVLEPDPLSPGLGGPPALLELPLDPRRTPPISNRPGLEDPIVPQTMPRFLSEGEPKPTGIPPVPSLDRTSEKATQPMPNLEAPIRPNFSGNSAALPDLYRVPGFNDVYTGRKPALGGFDQLKANGVKSVVYLHPPKTDLSAPRKMAEKAGLLFEPIEVQAEKLREAADKFATSIKDSSRRPIFVYDETGVHAGVLWYLFLREQQYQTNDVARVRANDLGLKQMASPEDVKLWNAAQDLVR